MTSPKIRLLRRVLGACAAVGIAGSVTLLIVGLIDRSLITGWTMALFLSLFVIGGFGAYGFAFVPSDPRNDYATQSRPAAVSIPEFPETEAARARTRRAVAVTALAASFFVWTGCLVVGLLILGASSGWNLDADVDPTLGTLAIGLLIAGAVAFVPFVVLAPITSRISVDGPHMRALEGAFPGAYVRMNRTTERVTDMVMNTAPGASTGRGGLWLSYIAVTDSSLSIWSARRGILTRLVEVPLATITSLDAKDVSLRVQSSPGLVVTTTVLNEPLELAPVDHFADFAASAERLALVLRERMR